jgi:multisubunit Na+/H+ antiporter MnhG subunit
MKPKLYRHLPGRGRRAGFVSFGISSGWSSLWLGPDHLLSVDSQNYREEYKRFYYRDIQAVITRRTARATGWNTVLVILLALFVALIFVAELHGRIIGGILAGTTLLILLINLVRGPTGVCHLITAVHTEQLPSLNRLKTARKVVARLRPLIEAAQGTVTPELLQAAAAQPIEARRPFAAAPARGRRPVRHDSGNIHAVLFTMLTTIGLWRFLELFHNSFPIAIVSVMLNTSLMGLTIWALIRQIDTDLPVGVRRLAISSLGNILLSGLIGFSTMIIWVVHHQRTPADDQWQLFKAYAEMSPLDSMWLTGLYTVTILFTVGLGVPGLILLQRHRRQWERLSQPPPPKV